MELIFLGTGAGTPTKQRNVTAIVLNLLAENGACWLFDCGEATQHQIMRSTIKLSKICKIFVTHLHGDHIFGIPGLLSSRSNQGGTAALTIYGPTGIKQFIETAFSVSQTTLAYPLNIVEIMPGMIYQDEFFQIEADHVVHRIESFGYRIMELDRIGKLDTESLRKLGITEGPLWGQLKKGQSIKLAEGTIIHGKDYIGQPIMGRKIAIIGDTRRCDTAVKLAEDVDLLVHEATFTEQYQELAHQYSHSSTIDAAMTAKEAKVKKLILTHFSSRYQEEDMESLLKEAQNIYEPVFLAADLSSFAIELHSE